MRLHVVDGTYELYRAHYSPRPSRLSPEGRDVKATAGVIASLMVLMRDSSEAVTHLAVTFDNPIRSFRNNLFDGYKSDEGVPPELRAQFDLVEEGVRALGVTVWSMREHEADDAMATAAARFADQVEQVRLMTPDKDMQQCLRGERVVMVDRMRRRVIDEAALLAARGLRPASVPDFLALTGDDADGVPGLPGFGAVSAAALLGRYGHIEAIPDHPHQWDLKLIGARRLAATLAERRAEALFYRQLTRLVDDAPISRTLDEISVQPPTPAFLPFCERIGARDLMGVSAPA